MTTPATEPGGRRPTRTRAADSLDLREPQEDGDDSFDLGRILSSPWVRVGLAVGLGFLAGSRKDSALVKVGMRLAFTAAARSLLHDALDRARA